MPESRIIRHVLEPDTYMLAVNLLRNFKVTRYDLPCEYCTPRGIPHRLNGRIIATHPETMSVSILQGWD